MDLWYFFGSLALDLIKPETGKIGYIAPNNWITNAGASKFRNIVLEKGKIEKFIDFGDFKVFDSAGIQTMIYIMSRSDNNHIYDAKYSKVIDKKIKHKDAQAFLIGLQDKRFEYFYMTLEKANLLDKPISFINFQVQKVIKIIQLKRNFSLKDNEVGQGIVGAPDKAFIVSVDEYKKFNDIEKKYLKTFYTNAGRYYPNSTDKYIFYLSEKSFSGDISEYENILEHFSKYKDDLIRAKIQYKSPDKKYYFLHRERDDKFFKVGPKIICASRTEKPACTYTDDEFYGSRALNFIKTGNIDLKFLSTILNSGLSDFWLRNMGKMTGELLQIDKGQLLSIPLYKPQKLDQKPFIKKADIMLELNKKFHEQSSQFLQRMMDNYDLEKPNKKLQKFWELDFGEFVSEMRKKSANVPLSTQDELQDYFEKNKSELLELDNHITTTDREIDAMVYELYGLNDDEIKIIENS